MDYNQTLIKPLRTEGMPLFEMARINKRETGKDIYPYNGWEVKIFSNDHNPPHFHIIRDGWDVSFAIEDGAMLNLGARGKDQAIFSYMVANVGRWLSLPCALEPTLTNRQNAMMQWEQLHDD